MPSFTLKPEERIHIFTVAEHIIMTVPRDQVPILLEGNVPLHVWTDTYDKVMERYKFVLESFHPCMLVPCFIICFIPSMMRIAKENQQEWLRLVQEQADVYRAFGVLVTLAEEAHSSGSGSDSSTTRHTVGLHFAIGPAAQAAPVYGQPPPNQNIASQLAELANLHKTGALNDTEFQQAKDRLLSSR
jgi:hypothetical protein